MSRILIDIDRVFADIEFFRAEHVKRITEEVMAVWSVNHLEGYNQGMLYILNVVIFIVYHADVSDFYTDSYMIFDRIMSIEILNYYSKNPAFLNKKCRKIVDNHIKAIDVEFFILIEKHEIDIRMVLMYFPVRKWLRCLFAKEFYFEEILDIWEFALCVNKDNGFDMVEFFALGMLIWTRDASNV